MVSPPPSRSAALNVSNIQLLATPHGKNRVQEFVASQARYAKAQANEGRAVLASWDISTPERDKMRLHQLSAGFETPVLRPRAAPIPAEPNHRPASPRSKSPAKISTTSTHSLGVKKAKATSAIREVASPKRLKKTGNKSTTKRSRTSNPARKKRRHARSDTDDEYLARLSERRERKRARREIMNPREVKVDTRGEKENRNDEKKGPNDKKHKIPAGLALMHGFSSTSVGKGRLTIEPPPNFGVFNKGRASAKIKVDELKRTENRRFSSRIFSEDRFLDSRPSKLPEERPLDSETSPGGNASHVPSSAVKMKKSAAVQTREIPMKMKRTIRRYQPVATTQCDSEVANSNTSRAASGQGTKPTDQAEPMNAKSRARSESWVIEQDGFSLPSTTSDVSIASVKSKPETAFLDVRAAAWSRFLKKDLLDEKVQFPHHKNPQAISTRPATTVIREAGSNAHLELEEQATLGPWESASQVARSILHPQEPANSKYFVLPHGGESRIIQPIIHLASKSSSRPVSINDAYSNKGGDTTIDEPLVYGETSVDYKGGDLLPVSVLANASPATTGFAFPEERVSVLQASSLDSVDRALLEIPGITHRSRIRRRSTEWREFNPENMLYHQYGLDPTDSQCEVWGPFIHDHGHSDSGPADASNFLGDSTALGNMHDNTLSFRGENYTEGLEGGSEDQAGRNEYYPVTNSDLPEFASDVAHIPLNYDCRDEVPFFVGKEDTDYERVIEKEEDCTGIASVSIPSTDWSASPEGDADNIHLWGDEAWPRGEAVGENTLQEGCSHLTTVQKVEQDVARKLKGHWFPLKY